MMKIGKANHVFNTSISNEPAQYCHSGDIVKFETMDCFSNVLIPESTEFEVDILKNTNPATGPLYIYDGEIGECGLEIEGMVTIIVTVLKGKRIAAPILETEDFIEIIGLGSTLEEASQNASRHMHDYMIKELNMSENDAAIRLCLCGNLKICHHVNSVKTVAMRIDKGMIT